MIGGIEDIMKEQKKEDRRDGRRENMRYDEQNDYYKRDYDDMREYRWRDLDRREELDGDLGSTRLKISSFKAEMIQQFIWSGKER